MIDSVMPSCCSRMTAAMQLATRYTTPAAVVEIEKLKVLDAQAISELQGVTEVWRHNFTCSPT